MTSITQQKPQRLVHYTPLRYPGGKGKLAGFIKELIKENGLLDGEYVEAYAGGAAIGLELLFHDYVSRIHINDLSRPVFSFWHSVLNETDRLCQLIRDTPLTLKAWDKQKGIFGNPRDQENLGLGFATFYLNRTNRSGILNGGVIGGRAQTSEWGIGARFNRTELIHRVESIAKMKRRINLTRMDALKFLKSKVTDLPAKTLIYLDPPYYVQGRNLYYDFYQHSDHEAVSKFVRESLIRQRWIVSYDNVHEIRKMYKGCQRLTYSLGYSARDTREGSEVIFFSDTLRTCPLTGPFKTVRGRNIKKTNNELRGNKRAPRKSSAVLSREKRARPRPNQQHKRLTRSRNSRVSV